jgi:hypothetical protein
MAVTELRRDGGDEEAAITHGGVNPGVGIWVREGDFLAGFAADLARHDGVATFAFVLPIPDRRILAVASPGGIEVGEGAIGEHMKAGAVGIDDAELSDPVAHDGIVFEAAEEDEVIARLRPRGFEIPMPGGDGLTLRLTEDGDVDFAILVVGGAVGFGSIRS